MSRQKDCKQRTKSDCHGGFGVAAENAAPARVNFENVGELRAVA